MSPSTSSERVLATESWLVTDGAVLAWDLHRLRFARGVGAQGGDRADALAHVRLAQRETPSTGRWWPRVDLLAAGGFRTRVRPAPESLPTATVVTAREDPRTTPTIKGPDLSALAALAERASSDAGADVDPILCSAGFVADSTRSGVLWWRGDALCAPDDGVAHLASVTQRVILGLAASDGLEVRRERARPDDLEGCELWLVSTTRGIRTVTSWLDGPRLAAPQHASAWRSRLRRLRTVPRA